jgi:hypothetical protein
MPHKLSQLWRDQPDFLAGKSYRQIIQISGDGRLRDGNETSVELRDWLSVIPLERLRQCAEECLLTNFEDSGQALQDSINELGVRLGFKVTPGRYRGVKNSIGNDGLWVGEDGFGFLIEVKTTDAYRINLDRVSHYRTELVGNGKIDDDKSSVVIVVGRQDTGDLEAQIRGSQHAWDIRLISVDALLRLADVKEQLNDWATSNKINHLLRPVEYTRLDGIVDLLFAAKQDLEKSEAVAKPEEDESKEIKVTAGKYEAVRETAVRKIGEVLKTAFVRVGKAIRASGDGKVRLVCIASQRYEGPSGSSNYWYGFTPAQKSFLDEAAIGYLSLVCADSGRIYLIPRENLFSWLQDSLTTPPEPEKFDDIRHWHVYFNDHGDHVDLMKSGGGVIVDLTKYILST